MWQKSCWAHLGGRCHPARLSQAAGCPPPQGEGTASSAGRKAPSLLRRGGPAVPVPHLRTAAGRPDPAAGAGPRPDLPGRPAQAPPPLCWARLAPGAAVLKPPCLRAVFVSCIDSVCTSWVQVWKMPPPPRGVCLQRSGARLARTLPHSIFLHLFADKRTGFSLTGCHGEFCMWQTPPYPSLAQGMA